MAAPALFFQTTRARLRAVVAAILMLGAARAATAAEATLAAPASAQAAHAGRDAPEARYAIVIGQNEGHDPAHTLRYAQADAERLARVLSQSGDMTKVELLVDASASSVQ